MILYADTSSLVKRYVGEPHRDEVLTWFSAADAVATSRVAYPEIAAALGARQSRGDIAAVEVRGLVDMLFETWDDYLVVDLDELRAARVELLEARWNNRGDLDKATERYVAAKRAAELQDSVPCAHRNHRFGETCIWCGGQVPTREEYDRCQR